MHLLLCTCLKETRVLSIFFFNIFIYCSIYTDISHPLFYVTFIVWRVMRFNSPCVRFTMYSMDIGSGFTYENIYLLLGHHDHNFLLAYFETLFTRLDDLRCCFMLTPTKFHHRLSFAIVIIIIGDLRYDIVQGFQCNIISNVM